MADAQPAPTQRVVGTGHAADIRGIQREISRLWQDAVASAATLGSSASRASVLNLVIYAGTTFHEIRASGTIAALASRHPSRTIIISQAPEPQAASFDARISLHCQPSHSNRRQVCHEEIHIRTEPRAMVHVPGMIEPLLIPAQPVFAWWLEEPRLDDAIFGYLTALAERIIVDSAVFRQPLATMARLHDIVERESDRTKFSDVNWGRITPWREIVAQFFDPPDQRSYLPHVDEVEITATAGAQSAEALLLTGWLAGRLHWSVTPRPHLVASDPPARSRMRNQPPGQLDLRLFRHVRPTRVRIVPTEATSADYATISAVTLRATEVDATFAIAPTDDGEFVTATASLPGQSPRTRSVLLQQPSASAILAQELSVFGHDRIYEEALGAIRSWERAR